MRNLKFIRLLPSVLVIILITMISSCVDDNEPIPDYAGKWVTEKTVAVSSGYTKVNYSLEITDNHFVETFFEDVYRYQYPNPGKFVTIEGSISVSGNVIEFTASKISFSNYDIRTSVLSDPYETHLKEDQNFQTIFDSLDFPTSEYQVEFSIDNDMLILQADKDNDGAYSGFDELITYTKKSILEVSAPIIPN